MKLSSFLKICAAASAVMCLAACEWGAGSDANSWSDSFNWVNFSGAYRSNGSQSVEKVNTVTSGSTTTTSTSTSTVSTGKQVYTVVQSGQNLTITDGRSGAVFNGKFSSLRSASGYENGQAVASDGGNGVKTQKDHAMPPGGDTIIGSFEVKGNAGRMVGTLQGTVYDTDANGTGDVFGNRTLTATLVGPTSTVQIEAACQANTVIGGTP